VLDVCEQVFFAEAEIATNLYKRNAILAAPTGVLVNPRPEHFQQFGHFFHRE